MKDESKPPALFVPEQSDYYGAAGAMLIPASWTLQVVFTSHMLDANDGMRETADLVVSIPWPLAKAMAAALHTAVGRYEEVAGEINLPPGVIENITTSRLPPK